MEVFKGKGIIRTVYKDIIKESERQSGEILISGVDEKKFLEEDRTALQQHLRRLRELKCKERILIKEGDTYLVGGMQTAYRWVPKEFFNPTPIYVYNNKLFIIIWGNPAYAILIENPSLADAHRKQFNLIWSMAKKVRKKKAAR